MVDIPISNCINSNINRIFVLTQFNSASLNKHIKNTYHFSAFSTGFVDILAAEQTPDNPGWYQGTADAVRQCLRHIANNDYEYVLILSGDQLYQMDFAAMLDAHKEKDADISIATIPVSDREAPEFGIMKKDDENYITSVLLKNRRKIFCTNGRAIQVTRCKRREEIILPQWAFMFLHVKCLDDLLKDQYPAATDFGKEIIPARSTNTK